MRPRTCIAVLSLFLILFAEPATAQNPEPERGTSLAFGFSDGATVGVWVPAGPRWDVGVEFSARWVETDEDESLENRTRGFTAAVPLKRYLDVDGSVVPFLVFGPFVEHSRTRVAFAGSSASSRQWRTGGRFGVGLDWFVSDRVSIGGHAGVATPTRYPNGFDQGAPTDYYTGAEAEAAIRDAESILEFCRGALG